MHIQLYALDHLTSEKRLQLTWEENGKYNLWSATISIADNTATQQEKIKAPAALLREYILILHNFSHKRTTDLLRISIIRTPFNTCLLRGPVLKGFFFFLYAGYFEDSWSKPASVARNSEVEAYLLGKSRNCRDPWIYTRMGRVWEQCLGAASRPVLPPRAAIPAPLREFWTRLRTLTFFPLFLSKRFSTLSLNHFHFVTTPSWEINTSVLNTFVGAKDSVTQELIVLCI